MAESATADPLPVQGGVPNETSYGAPRHTAPLEQETPWTGGVEDSRSGIAEYRLPSAAAGSVRDLTPASPNLEEAYSPPLEDETQWASEGPVGREPMVNRVSPLMTPQLSSVPTEVGGEAVGLAPVCAETPPLSLPEARGEL